MDRRLLLVLVLGLGVVMGRASTALPAWAQDAPADGPATEESPARGVAAAAEGAPRYLEAIRTELEAMGIAEVSCEAADAQRANCNFRQTGAETDRVLEVQLAYSDVTDTIYLYANRYLSAPSDGEHTNALLRRLMELNWTMLLGKFEWDPTDGEVRLAMVLNTDSNFDRRAFRSAVRALGALGDRYYPELHRLETTGR